MKKHGCIYGWMNGANSDNAVSIQTMVTRTGYSEDDWSEHGCSEHGYSEHGYSEHGWLEPGYSEHGLTEPGYSEHGSSEVTWNPVTTLVISQR